MCTTVKIHKVIFTDKLWRKLYKCVQYKMYFIWQYYLPKSNRFLPLKNHPSMCHDINSCYVYNNRVSVPYSICLLLKFEKKIFWVIIFSFQYLYLFHALLFFKWWIVKVIIGNQHPIHFIKNLFSRHLR